MREFHIAIEGAVLKDMRQRLAHTRWPADPPASGWDAGTDPSYMRELVGYWLEEFDWRRCEAGLNQHPQFVADVDGQAIHFVHVRGSGPRPLPLVLTHGWPGSFVEYLGLVDRLTHPQRHGLPHAQSFDVVIPSLPGFGFSGRPVRPLGPRKVATLWRKLMQGVLGYRCFAAHGGDWGSIVSGWLGADHPDVVVALHLGAMGVGPWRGDGASPPDEDESAWIRETRDVLVGEGAYQHLQATKPQTLAYALADSPVALAAWIVEKFHGWADSSEGMPSGLPMDVLLANIMVYWVSGNADAASWIYRAARSNHELTLGAGERVRVPSAFLLPARDLFPPCPRAWLERAYEVARYEVLPGAGHFTALERGVELAESIAGFMASDVVVARSSQMLP